MCGVYAIRHVASGRCYVGSSVRIAYRWYQHKAALRHGRHHSRHLQHAWAKYGEGAFEFVVLEQADGSQLVAREQFHIDALNAAHPKLGFNTAPVAGSVLGCKNGPCSPDRKAKIGVANRGRIPSAETREKQANAKRGRTLSAETREKMRLSQAARRTQEAALRPEKPDTRAWQWMTDDEFRCAVEMYQAGATLRESADAFGVTKSSLSSRMKRHGIQARSRRRAA